jgi:formate dehydrogenase (NADP+) beta subunit
MSMVPDKSGRFPARFNDLAWYRSNVPCMEACPVHTDSGRYVQLIANGRFNDAFHIARSPNPLASICGRVCAAPCEDACRRSWIDEAVTIRPLKRFLTERYGSESVNPDEYKRLLTDQSDVGCQRTWHMPQLPKADKRGSGKKVAVVGSGPAGMGCAHDLALLGYEVTIFEALPLAGGMLRYGIPEYRLPRGVIDNEVATLINLGVKVKTGTPLTSTFNLQALRDDGFESIFLSVGAMKGRELNIPGHELDGVIKAVDFLLNVNQGYRVDLGKKVAVIGGGSVALDAARSAVREFYTPMSEIEKTAEAVVNQPAMDAARGALRSGAAEVYVVSLESLDELPSAKTVQGKEELHEANMEGIQLRPSWGPKAILGTDRVEALSLVGVTRVFDEEGRFSPQFDEAKTQQLNVDSVILAIGQQPELDFISDSDGLELTRAGTIKIDPDTLATTAAGVYAGGDAAFGPRILIEAVANGKKAARSIDSFLSGSSSSPSTHVTIEKIAIDDYKMPPAYEKLNRTGPDTIDVGRRTGITEVETVFDEATAKEQAERCLSCHIDTIYDPELCVLCGRCTDVCPEKCLHFVPIGEVDMPEDQKQAALEAYGINADSGPLTVLLKDDTACIRCGLCAQRCPTEAMTMERFNFVETVE